MGAARGTTRHPRNARLNAPLDAEAGHSAVGSQLAEVLHQGRAVLSGGEVGLVGRRLSEPGEQDLVQSQGFTESDKYVTICCARPRPGVTRVRRFAPNTGRLGVFMRVAEPSRRLRSGDARVCRRCTEPGSHRSARRGGPSGVGLHDLRWTMTRRHGSPGTGATTGRGCSCRECGRIFDGVRVALSAAAARSCSGHGGRGQDFGWWHQRRSDPGHADFRRGRHIAADCWRVNLLAD
jgi:hypothetical protein